MTLTLAAFNALPNEEAAGLLRDCCGSSRWVEGMLDRRPFLSRTAVLVAASEVWHTMGPGDWDEAFAHHPRIGESRAAAEVSGAARAWSGGEQGAVTSAEAATRRLFAEGNREYERRFGRIYIVCATGRTPEQLLDDLRGRLDNDPETEQAIAAAEQLRITILRLEKLLSDEKATRA